MLPGGLALAAYGVWSKDDFQLRNGRDCLWRDRLSCSGCSDMRDFLHHPADKWRGGHTHMARTLAAAEGCHGNGVFGRELQPLPPVARWLWATVAGTVVSLFDEILSKEV